MKILSCFFYHVFNSFLVSCFHDCNIFKLVTVFHLILFNLYFYIFLVSHFYINYLSFSSIIYQKRSWKQKKKKERRRKRVNELQLRGTRTELHQTVSTYATLFVIIFVIIAVINSIIFFCYVCFHALPALWSLTIKNK